MTRMIRVAMSMMVGGVSLVLVAAAPAHALPPGCEASIDNSAVENHQTPASAKEVDAGDRAVIRGVDAGGAGQTKVGIQIDPFPSVPVRDEAESGTDWSGDVNVDDYATYGVGLYKVTASSENCSGFVWIRVTGKSPFTTVAGIIAAVLVFSGIASAVITIIRARGRRDAGGAGNGGKAPIGRILSASLRSGVPIGLGAMIFAQQSGVLPINGATIVAWLVFASSTVGLALLLVGGLRRSRTAPA